MFFCLFVFWHSLNILFPSHFFPKPPYQCNSTLFYCFQLTSYDKNFHLPHIHCLVTVLCLCARKTLQQYFKMDFLLSTLTALKLSNPMFQYNLSTAWTQKSAFDHHQPASSCLPCSHTPSPKRIYNLNHLTRRACLVDPTKWKRCSVVSMSLVLECGRLFHSIVTLEPTRVI